MEATKDITYRKEAAAAYLGTSLSTFNRLYKTGKILGYKSQFNSKNVYFRKKDLDKLVEQYKVDLKLRPRKLN